MEKHDISGVAYVTGNGQVLCQVARVVAKAVENKEMTIDTLFPIGSNSKQFCATAVLLLQEQGKLSVNDSVTEYFPEYTKAQRVTVKDATSVQKWVAGVTTGFSIGKYIKF